MLEALSKVVERGIEKLAGGIKPKELPPEITKASGSDFKPPWKPEPDIPISSKTDTGFKPPWKGNLAAESNAEKSVKSMNSLDNEGSGGTPAEVKKPGLTEDQKAKVREVHPDWPDEIIDAIGSWEEYSIYDKAGLVYAEIDGKSCLIRPDIDMNKKDEFGRTNKERMEQGLAPLDKHGNSIELHHIGQKSDSPLAELTQEEHRGHGNDSILHDKTKPTEIDRGEFQREKESHWETRVG